MNLAGALGSYWVSESVFMIPVGVSHALFEVIEGFKAYCWVELEVLEVSEIFKRVFMLLVN